MLGEASDGMAITNYGIAITNYGMAIVGLLPS